jgi:phosphohistidine swiveling domain-containing protein
MKKDTQFDFNFSANGTPFLFEDLVNDGYMPVESIVFGYEGREFSYWERETNKNARETGLARTPEETEAISALLTKLVEDALAEIPALEKKQIAQKDARHVFNLITNIFDQYRYFDYAYWDRVFEESGHNAVAKKNVELVEAFKNAIRARMEKVFFGNDSLLQILVQKVSEEFDLPREIVNWYRGSEVLGLFNGARVSEKELADRKEAWALHKSSTGVEFLTGSAARACIDRIQKESAGETILLKGKVANKGPVVRGAVRKIMRNYGNRNELERDMAMMRDGEVLISDSTDPELIPAFKKASAVVTDAGGLLSHAAITSREFGLPCIVGTGFATKVLKNGDEVEVDTEKGEVRILNRI